MRKFLLKTNLIYVFPAMMFIATAALMLGFISTILNPSFLQSHPVGYLFNLIVGGAGSLYTLHSGLKMVSEIPEIRKLQDEIDKIKGDQP